MMTAKMMTLIKVMMTLCCHDDDDDDGATCTVCAVLGKKMNHTFPSKSEVLHFAAIIDTVFSLSEAVKQDENSTVAYFCLMNLLSHS